MGYLIFAYKIALVVYKEYQESYGLTLLIRCNSIRTILTYYALLAHIYLYQQFYNQNNGQLLSDPVWADLDCCSIYCLVMSHVTKQFKG